MLYITIGVNGIQSTIGNTGTSNAIELLSSVEKTPFTKALHFLKIERIYFQLTKFYWLVNLYQTVTNFGYRTTTYWVNFKLINQTDLTKRLVEITYPPLIEIEIFLFLAMKSFKCIMVSCPTRVS
ncbi:7TM-DISM domain-containing protein [Sporosarcina oncorhynchi]|uniref:7TM-DISM domain-containing protein n=1 Tax=Sporosarcina oncorhynchi TaxID=3056444 RepID=UPI003D675946